MANGITDTLTLSQLTGRHELGVSEIDCPRTVTSIFHVIFDSKMEDATRCGADADHQEPSLKAKMAPMQNTWLTNAARKRDAPWSVAYSNFLHYPRMSLIANKDCTVASK